MNKIMNNYICLDCKTEQPDPSDNNPFAWCINCQAPYYKMRDTNFYTKDGYIDLSISRTHGQKTYEICMSYSDPYGIYKKAGMLEALIHKIKCDDTDLAFVRLHETFGNADNVLMDFPLHDKELEYVKKIDRFENGKFHFKGEDK